MPVTTRSQKRLTVDNSVSQATRQKSCTTTRPNPALERLFQNDLPGPQSLTFTSWDQLDTFLEICDVNSVNKTIFYSQCKNLLDAITYCNLNYATAKSQTHSQYTKIQILGKLAKLCMSNYSVALTNPTFFYTIYNKFHEMLQVLHEMVHVTKMWVFEPSDMKQVYRALKKLKKCIKKFDKDFADLDSKYASADMYKLKAIQFHSNMHCMNEDAAYWHDDWIQQLDTV